METNNQKNGGNNGSATFAVSYATSYGASGAYMYFQTEGAEYEIDHAYITNNTYAVLSMTNGDRVLEKNSPMKIRIGSNSQSKVLIQREQLQEKSNFIWQISVHKMQPAFLLMETGRFNPTGQSTSTQF